MIFVTLSAQSVEEGAFKYSTEGGIPNESGKKVKFDQTSFLEIIMQNTACLKFSATESTSRQANIENVKRSENHVTHNRLGTAPFTRPANQKPVFFTKRLIILDVFKFASEYEVPLWLALFTMTLSACLT